MIPRRSFFGLFAAAPLAALPVAAPEPKRDTFTPLSPDLQAIAIKNSVREEIQRQIRLGGLLNTGLFQ